MFLDPRNGPAWDLAGGEPRRTYVVLATPRTGSTLLCRTLWDTGRAAAPKEYCNPMQAHDWAMRRGERTAPAALRVLWERTRSSHFRRRHPEQVRGHRTTRDGLFGIKLQPAQVERWFGDGDGVERALGPVTWITLRRLDEQSQLDSWLRAARTGHWSATQRSSGLPVPRAWLEDELARRLACMDRWMTGRPHLSLTTESVFRDLPGALRTVLACIGQPTTGPMPPAALRSQSDQADISSR